MAASFANAALVVSSKRMVALIAELAHVILDTTYLPRRIGKIQSMSSSNEGTCGKRNGFGPITTQKNGEPRLAVDERNAQLDQNLAVIFKNTRRPSES